MVDAKVTLTYACLVGASIYGIVKSNGKKWALAAFVLYLLNGGLGIAYQVTDNTDIWRILRHESYVTYVSALDLITTDICLNEGIEQKWALLNLIPPAVDLVMRYLVDESWDPLTSITHIGSVCLIVYLGSKEPKHILFATAASFLIALFSRRYRTTTGLITAIAVLFTGFYFEGKDLNDLIPQ